MKKRFLPVLLVIFTLLSLLPAASAEISCELGTVYTGMETDCAIAVLPEGTPYNVAGLPEGLRVDHYDGMLHLRGAALYSGTYYFVISTADPMIGIITCNLNVSPSSPEVYASADVNCFVGERALLSVGTDSMSGYVSYQWFTGCTPDGIGGYAIPGANGAEYSPDTSLPGTAYYYCSVSTNLNGVESRSVSRPICVSVTGVDVQSIAVNTLPTYVEYGGGQIQNIIGLTLEVIYAQGRGTVIDSGFSVTPGAYDPATRTLSMTAEYMGRTCSFSAPVTSTDPEVTGISVVSLPYKQEYRIGEMLDGTGLSFRVFYSDGSFSDETEGYTVQPQVFDRAGVQTVTLSYLDKFTTFSITVKEEEKNLEIASTPAKLTYTVGESVNTAGLVVRDTVNGIPVAVNSGFTVEPNVFTYAGRQTVTVRYNGKTASFTVDVKENSVPVPAQTPEPTAEPESNVTPTKSPRISGLTKAGQSNKSLLITVLVLALLALAALGVYMLIQEKGGVEEIRYKIECFLYNMRKKK